MAAPTVSSIAIRNTGVLLDVTFSRAVTETDADGWTLTIDGAAHTLAYLSGSGTVTVTFGIAGRPVSKHDVASYTYTSVSGDAEATDDAAALATIATTAVTNSSAIGLDINALPSGEINRIKDVPPGGSGPTTTESSEFFTVWNDTEVASDNADNPFSDTDGECFSFGVPCQFCGWFGLRHKRVYNGTETLTDPIVFVYGRKGGEWFIIPDTLGAYGTTISGDRINYDPTGITNDAAAITQEHLFDLRGSDEVKVLVSTAYANGAATTKEAILQGRFFTFS